MVARFEYIESVIDTYRQAAEANRSTRTRQGNVIVLTDADDADDVMITADLHGHRKNFNAIKRIADLKNKPKRHLILQEVCHGGPTYPVNGGCMSHTMLEDVARLKVEFPERIHILLSNHEMAELTDYPILKQKRMLNLMFRMGMQEAYGPAADRVREAMCGFLRSCPLGVRLPGGVFVCHSAPERMQHRRWDRSLLDRPLQAVDFQEHGDLFDLLWGRDYSTENALAFAKTCGASVLIHGHEPCEQGFHVPNGVQIILDCCGDRACYLLVPIDREFLHEGLVERIERLE